MRRSTNMFGLAKTVGANAISCEIPLSHTKRLGEFGEKHKMMIGYHGHTNVTSPEAFGRPESWETAMSYSKYNGINLGYWALRLRQQPIAHSIPGEVPRPRDPHPCEGPEDEQRTQRAIRPRRHADRGNPEADADAKIPVSRGLSRWSTRCRRIRR